MVSFFLQFVEAFPAKIWQGKPVFIAQARRFPYSHVFMPCISNAIPKPHAKPKVFKQCVGVDTRQFPPTGAGNVHFEAYNFLSELGILGLNFWNAFANPDLPSQNLPDTLAGNVKHGGNLIEGFSRNSSIKNANVAITKCSVVTFGQWFAAHLLNLHFYQPRLARKKAECQAW